MMRPVRTPSLLSMIFLTALIGATGCDLSAPATDVADSPQQDASPPTNRIPLPAGVRSNLGITFATVERRRIEETLRVPGRFEYLPTARHDYRAPMTGQVDLLVDQFDVVEAGTLLYRLDAPDWRTLQRELSEAASSVTEYESILASFLPLEIAHQRREQALTRSVANWTARIEQIEAIRDAGGGRAADLASARASLASVEAELAEVLESEAEHNTSLATSKARLRGAQARHDLLLGSIAAILDTTPQALQEEVTTASGLQQRWQTITEIEIRSTEDGVVESIDLTDGVWAEAGSSVLQVVQPDRLRFHAQGLQSDLGVLSDDLTVRVVPPAPTAAGRGVPLQDVMSGELTVGLQGDPDNRTIDLYMIPDEIRPWARPGVLAHMEIVTDSTAPLELAVPVAALQWDGLTPVLFRRAPDNPNEAIRIEADLGAEDGRWVAILSGLRDGDEVVLDGGFQLLLATSGTIQKGGHFHADGTYHEGEH